MADKSPSSFPKNNQSISPTPLAKTHPNDVYLRGATRSNGQTQRPSTTPSRRPPPPPKRDMTMYIQLPVDSPQFQNGKPFARQSPQQQQQQQQEQKHNQPANMTNKRIRPPPPRRQSLTRRQSDTKPFEVLGQEVHGHNRRGSTVSSCSMSTNSSSDSMSTTTTDDQIDFSEVLKESPTAHYCDDTDSVTSMSMASSQATSSSSESSKSRPKHKRNRSLFKKKKGDYCVPSQMPKDVIRWAWLDKKTKKHEQGSFKKLVKTYMRRFAVLTETTLNYYEQVPFNSRGRKIEKQKPSGGLFLSTLTAVEMQSLSMQHRHGVTLKSRNEHLLLSFDSADEQAEWFDTLSEIFKRNQNAELNRRHSFTSPSLFPGRSEQKDIHTSMTPPANSINRKGVHRRSKTLPPVLQNAGVFQADFHRLQRISSNAQKPPPLQEESVSQSGGGIGRPIPRQSSTPVHSGPPSVRGGPPRIPRQLSGGTPFSVLSHKPPSSNISSVKFATYTPTISERPCLTRETSKGTGTSGLADDAPKFRRRKIHRAKTAPQAHVEQFAENLENDFAQLRVVTDLSSYDSEDRDSLSPLRGPEVLVESPRGGIELNSAPPIMQEYHSEPPPPPPHALPKHVRQRSAPAYGMIQQQQLQNNQQQV